MTQLDRLGGAVRRAQEDPAAEARTLAEARARVLQPVPRGPRSRGRLVFLSVALAAACALVWWRASPRPALRYRVDGGATLASGEVPSTEHEQALRFDDGSEVRLSPHASVRVAEADSDGARVEVRGRVHARIHHEATTSWRFDAGPYRVHVIGTAFDIAWDEHAFELRVEEGEVRVDGPDVRDRHVRGGETLSLRAEETASVRPPSENPVLAEAEAVNEPTPDPIAETAARRVPSAARNEPETEIAPVIDPAVEAPTPTEVALGLAGRAEHVEAMRSLDDAAFAWTVAHADARTLVALGDSARIARESARARSLLMSTRARFPGSPEAARASFILGRSAADEGDVEGAARFFERYLEEAPSGPLARDAMGRLLEARVTLGRDAHDLAAQYLERYPEGAHADTARSILE